MFGGEPVGRGRSPDRGLTSQEARGRLAEVGPNEPTPVRRLGVVFEIALLFGIILPFTPLARPLGFVPFSGTLLAFVAAATVTYLFLVELAKRWLMGCLSLV